MSSATETSAPAMRSWEDAVTWLVEQENCHEFVRDCYFDRPVINAVRRFAASEEWKEVKKWLPSPAGHALDVGAGNGLVSYALAKAGWTVSALEPDASDFVGAGAIRSIAAQESLPIKVVQEWGERMTFSNNQFDLIVARQVIHHAQDLNGMFNEMARVLKPNGTLLTCRDHVIDSPDGLQVFLRNHPLHRLYGGENAFTLAQYRKAIQKSGLHIVRQWNHFDSVINYAPLTRETICRKIAGKLPTTWLRTGGTAFLSSSAVFPAVMRLASLLYRRQGRAVSFLIRK